MNLNCHVLTRTRFSSFSSSAFLINAVVVSRCWRISASGASLMVICNLRFWGIDSGMSIGLKSRRDMI